MAGIVVNLEGVKAGFELLPEATVDARITKTTFKEAKTTAKDGRKYMNVNVELTISEEAGEPWAGRKAFVTLPTNPDGLGITKKALVDLGMDPEDLETSLDLGEVFESLQGADARVRVSVDTYQGEQTNRYKIVSRDSWQG